MTRKVFIKIIDNQYFAPFIIRHSPLPLQNNMSVKVQGLTKIYGAQRALDNISFEAKPGEILGFLGPNGAGKTTTMKILTCFIPQTEGKAEVCGFDVATQALEVRQKIGYLPEHNPLYKDMYVREYLEFVAGLHKLPKKKQRVADMIDRVGLGVEQNKPINALSKGYRQRVGLAQAMMHDPSVLILDEPTSGLDPNQLVEIRKLIKDLGKEKTVIFSTHIMQEVQALCDRVMIINKGSIVANDTIESLQNRITGENVAKIKNVINVDPLSKTTFRLTSSLKNDIRADVFNFAVENKLVLLEMHKEVYSVADVFQELTKSSN
jgi:ABC-2 type transport system ATP-binding protein